MGVDFSAEPNPEGLALAAQLRAERRQRDKDLEDRIVEAEVQELEAAGQLEQARVAAGRPVEADVETEEPVAEPVSVPDRRGPLSPRAQLEALAATSRPRQNDRQR